MCCSDPHGICYVETSNLDGETNLKIRQSHTETMHLNQDNIVSSSHSLPLMRSNTSQHLFVVVVVVVCCHDIC